MAERIRMGGLVKIPAVWRKWRDPIMTVYVLSVNREIAGVYDEYIKAYDIGCEKYNGDFNLEEFDVE